MIELDISIINKTYSGSAQAVIQNLSLKVNKGEFVSVIGPSGTGKTTMLNIIGGLDREFNGKISLLEKDLQTMEQPINCSYVFQEPRLMPWLTLDKNIRLVLKNEVAAENQIKQILRDVELDEYRFAFPSKLSGGMQRRAALARAFVTEPELMLLDEPFVSLDMPTANRLRNYLISIWQRKKPTIIFVTHDLREAITLSDRLIFLSRQPATVIKDISISLDRPRSINDSRVSEIYDALHADYPELLDGYIHDEEVVTPARVVV